MIGIATVARPDEDGMRKDSGRNSAYITTAKPTSPTSPSAVSAQCRTVSVIWPLFMITVMPRAMPMMSATPSRSRPPSTNAFVRRPSFMPPSRPMMMAKNRNDAVISGNHHHSVGSPIPRSDQGITAYIITAEGQREHREDGLVPPGELLGGGALAPV